ncbi:uncharacterized protein LOC120138501 [Hibiscus syriacus]|uniref:uncharacterized protein LOC120138501 n=1 Tax=Hibiscus syriacus TaxID=106335 RepID=UPI00192408CC|nr:uncharacterized protein LOC120138501 [Hibiscus syriacus]
MAISLNSVFGFNFKYVTRSSVGASVFKANTIVSPLQMYGSGGFIHQKRWGLCLSLADSDPLSADSSIKASEEAERLVSDDRDSAMNPPSLDDESRSQNSEASNGSMVSSIPEQDVSSSPNLQSTTRKVSLTAKERLRAARVLSRYTESKPSKSEMGSKVLDAMREGDKGKKRSRLPEAPTNLFDDSKRGLPKPGLTFQFPGGNDLLLIIFSVVFISTVMFTTTYIVWKVGAIHFNEY